MNAARCVGDIDLHPAAAAWRVSSQEVGFECDARGGLGGTAGGGVSAASFSVQTLLVSFDGGFQARLQVRRRRDERPEGGQKTSNQSTSNQSISNQSTQVASFGARVMQ